MESTTIVPICNILKGNKPTIGRFLNACEGKTYSQGGFNLDQYKEFLSSLFPNSKEKFQYMKRIELEQFCQKCGLTSKL